MDRDLKPAGRLPLLFLGVVSLVAGVLAGLARLGWTVPAQAASHAAEHAPLMISAFFGTVISLERAVALGRGHAYLAPALSGLAGAALLAGAPIPAVQALAVAGSVVMVAASIAVLRRLTAPFTLTLLAGALCWLVGNLVWSATGDPARAVPWWLSFLVLTIAGERLELTRFLPTPAAARPLFGIIAAALVSGAALSALREGQGLMLFSGALLALALWLARWDIARKNAGQRGLTRYIALCLLSGYGWLAFAGALGLAGALSPGHPWRDAAVHALALGFVFAMVFGHAPIILPAVARLKLPWHRGFYLPLLALHVGLATRMVGVLGGHDALRQGGGMANAAALLLFVLTLVSTILAGRRTKAAGAPRSPARGA